MEWLGKMNNIRNRAMEIVNLGFIYDKQEEMSKKVNHQPATTDIPKIFWKYFDLYRRKKISIYQYSENTGLSICDIEKFLKEITGKSSKLIEKTKQL